MYLARTLLVLLVVGVIGLVGYQLGVSQAIATQLPAAAPAAYPYWYGPGFGFGFFGFLFPLFFLFLLFGLMRAAFGGGHHRGDWGRGRWVSGRERIEEIHRELHGEKPTSGGSPGMST
jgi:hypothetical protein